MSQLYAHGFIQRDTLQWETTPPAMRLCGEIACLGNIVIGVQKILLVLDGQGDDALVQTVYYAYNASVRGYGNIFRYDNNEHYSEHPDAHHRHDFNWRTGAQRNNSPRWTGEWPTLGEFIEKVADWYQVNRDELPEPNAVPELGLR